MTTEDAVALEPCPWCNGPADIGEDECVHDVVFAFCTRCAAQGPFDADGDKDEARQLWNTRVTKQQHGDEVVERVARAICFEDGTWGCGCTGHCQGDIPDDDLFMRFARAALSALQSNMGEAQPNEVVEALQLALATFRASSMRGRPVNITAAVDAIERALRVCAGE